MPRKPKAFIQTVECLTSLVHRVGCVVDAHCHVTDVPNWHCSVWHPKFGITVDSGRRLEDECGVTGWFASTAFYHQWYLGKHQHSTIKRTLLDCFDEIDFWVPMEIRKQLKEVE